MEPGGTGQYVFSKLSSLLYGGGGGSDAEAVQRQYWMPDDISLECHDCTSKFTSFRRRHHCRVCGCVFCSKCCSSFIPGLPGHSGNSRVCNSCFKAYNERTQQNLTLIVEDQNLESDKDDFHQVGSSVQFKRRQSIDRLSSQLTPDPPSDASMKTSNRKASSMSNHSFQQFIPEDNTDLDDGHVNNEIIKLKDPQTLTRLWSRVIDPDLGVKLENHRSYLRSHPETFQGYKLVEWLMNESYTSEKEAVAIGQALLTAGMMISVSGSQKFIGGRDLYQPTTLHLTLAKKEKDDEPDSGVPATPRSSAVQEPEWMPEPNLPINFQSFEQMKPIEKEDVFNDAIETDQTPLKIDPVEIIAEENVDQSALDNYYKRHESDYLDYLLKVESIPEQWKEVIFRLADVAVSTVLPNIRYKGDDMNLLTYVKVKSVAGGDISECRMVEGEVCSLQLTHRSMTSEVENPRIALIKENIMFKDRNTMVSLETVTLQEAEYVKNVVGKLLELKPNVVLVEKSVAHLAQELLKEKGVSLAVNVKMKVLERLARMTQGSLIESVDTLITAAAPKLGTCGRVSTKLGENGRRLLVFEGCNPALGGSLLLRGGDSRFLSKVKAVLKRIIMVKYNWKHERSFLASEYGSLMDSSISLDSSDDFHSYYPSISPFIKIERSDNDVPFAVEVTDDTAIDDDCLSNGNDSQIEKHSWCEAFLDQKITNTNDNQLKDKLALFRAAGWRRKYDSCSKLKTVKKYKTVLPDDSCEKVPVQFSIFSKQSQVAPNYCFEPTIVQWNLYAISDEEWKSGRAICVSLGEFLDNLFSEPTCVNKQCTTSPIHHKQRFCYGEGAVTLHMQEKEDIIYDEDTLVMWKYCPICHLMITPPIPVEDATWTFSFAMFLNLLLHENQLVSRGASRPDAKCRHSLHQVHQTVFCKGNKVAIFVFSKLDVYDVATPPEILDIPKLRFAKETVKKKFLECKEASTSVYSSILAKLHGNPEAGLEKDHENEHRVYRERLEKLEESILYQDDDGVEAMSLMRLFQRDIIMSQISWTKRLNVKKLSSVGSEHLEVAKKQSIDSNKRPESENSDSTVMKLFSTILPHNEEVSLPCPFSPEMHMITHVKGTDLDFPSTHFVDEKQPSSLISYLLSSSSYHQFLASPPPGQDKQHFSLDLSDGTTKFFCCSYFTAEFHKLRQSILKETSERQEKFVQSLASCSRWEAMGGKSGLLFYKTLDDRFVLKQLSIFESQSFLDFAPHYFSYIEQSLKNNVKTLLGKIVGVFKVGFKNSVSGAGMNLEFLIMENLFYNRKVSKSYDLKGSVRNRLIKQDAGSQGIVGLDENFLQVSCEKPLYVNQQDKDILNAAIKRDASFLASHHMMDYSLLVGICNEENALVVGIIDYIRTFTWDKKLENLIKSARPSTVFGSQAKSPTVIHPDRYKVRFTEAMNRYFSVVQ